MIIKKRRKLVLSRFAYVIYNWSSFEAKAIIYALFLEVIFSKEIVLDFARNHSHKKRKDLISFRFLWLWLTNSEPIVTLGFKFIMPPKCSDFNYSDLFSTTIFQRDWSRFFDVIDSGPKVIVGYKYMLMWSRYLGFNEFYLLPRGYSKGNCFRKMLN